MMSNLHLSHADRGNAPVHAYAYAGRHRTTDLEASPKGKGCSLVPCFPDPGACKPKRQCHARNYYNPARNAVISRFTLCEWDQNNRVNYCVARTELDTSERMRTDAWRAVKMTDQLTRMRQNSNTRKLGDRLTDVEFWKNQLTHEMTAMNAETDHLMERKAVLEKLLADSQRPLAISEECMLQREKRTGVDQTFDEPEKGLCKEILIIRKCQRRMLKNIEKADIQNKMNRCARHALDIDVRDKMHTEDIDGLACGLRNCTFGIGYHPGVETVDNTVSNPQSWVKFTQENIERSRREREISEKLRVDIDLCIRQCSNDMWSQFNYINNAFKARIEENNDVIGKLERHLQKVNIEIRDLQRAVDLLRCAVNDKELPMKVAQTRLDERTRRLCVEVCHDEPMKGLQTEVYELRTSIAILKEKLRCAELALCRLEKTRTRLETELANKRKTVEVDSNCCLKLRDSMVLDARSGPMYTMTTCAESGANVATCGPRITAMVGSSCPPGPLTFTGHPCCT